MSGVSRFVRGHSDRSPRISLPVAKRLRLKTGSPLTRKTQLGTPSQAIEIDSDEERESSLLDDLNFNYSTSKPADMTAPHPDTKATKPTNTTSLSRKRKLNEYMSLKVPAINRN